MNYQSNQLPSNQSFGYFFSLVFFALALFFNNELPKYLSILLFIISVLFFFIAFFKPVLLKPFNILWMRFGLFLGQIISPIIMALIFYGIFSPISFLMKLFGRDELNLKFKPKKTYWIIRNIDKSSESFKNQF